MTLREAFPEAAAPPRSQVQLDLEAMAVIAENGGWCRNTIYGPDGTTCAIGIAAKIANSYDAINKHGVDHFPRLRAIVDALSERTAFECLTPASRTTAVIRYNDNVIRDGQAAARWFRAAAVDA